MKTYIPPQEAKRRFGFHPKSLNRWALEGKIDHITSPGGHYRYSVDSLEQLTSGTDDRKIVLYARVSTHTQKEGLNSQIDYISRAYPQQKVIAETGSGMNFKRKKFIEIMDAVHRREIKLIVVAHKDRLVRFGFDFVEWFCNINNCSIEVLNASYKTPHAELMDDFMSVIKSFAYKHNDIKKILDNSKSIMDKQDI